MSLITKEVVSEKDIKDFVNLPFEIYKGNTYWVPPIKKDERKSLIPKENPAYDFCDVQFWIVLKDGKCVGRIGAIINHKHNEKTGEKTGRISRTEFIDDPEVSKLLFTTAEKWLKEKGMENVQGPLGFTNLDTQGLLVEGFDHLQSAASVYHLPYYQEHFTAFGYEKEIDWVEFRLELGNNIPEKATRLADMIKTRYDLHVVSFKRTKDLLPYGHKIFGLLNLAFEELYSVVAFDDKMMDYYINKYLKLLNPEFVKLIETKTGELAGFIIGVPSLSIALQKANGKLFPFGFRHIMKALKHPTEMDLFLTGVDPKMQGMGVAALLITEIQLVLKAYNVNYVETTGIFETNQKAISNWKNYPHIQHKRKRAYRKSLLS
jgi:GNAT superfamily N-acetyltransferase